MHPIRALLLSALLTCSGAALAGTVGIVPECLFLDGFESGDLCAWNGLCPAPVPSGGASTEIQTARATLDGAAAVSINGALVTYVKETIGSDEAGFFVQAEPSGPALFIAVDPESLAPEPIAGDIVSFTITEMGTSFDLREALSLTNWSASGAGAWTPCYRQQVSQATDLVTDLDAYESELVSLRGTIAGAFGSAGTAFEAAELETAGIVGESNLELRVPTVLRDQLDLATGCKIALVGSPLWRLGARAQPSAWQSSDLRVDECPAPQVLSAVASGADEVSVVFDRTLDPASVRADGSQFVFDNGLVALAAAVTDETATVTTTTQTSVTYTVTVSGTVLDTLGKGVDAAANSESFSGGGCPTAPTNLMGCPSCGTGCTSPWPLSWSAVSGATHYIVQYSCLLSMTQYQTSLTSVDLCVEVGMCADNTCSSGAGLVTVQACNATCCSDHALVPTSGTPTTCGGGVCC